MILFLLVDTTYTFVQHSTKNIDGDFVPIVLPAERYQSVMSDPFGYKVIANNETYAAPNRFFVHWYISNFFKTVPNLLQKVVAPVESLYLATGISKTAIHFFLISILAFFAIGKNKSWTKWLLAATLFAPIFQSGGHFYKYIGIVDQSITYSSFYALPLSLFLLFLMPFYNYFTGGSNKMGIGQKTMLLILILILPFSGPLIPGIVLVIALLWTMHIGTQSIKAKHFKIGSTIPKSLIFYFVVLAILSLYSIYIGKYNAENYNWTPLSIAERYQRLPIGLYYQLTQKLAYPLVLSLILVNVLIIKKVNIEQQQMLKLLKWIGLFALVYLLLLPFGGSREYRPNIVRKDTLLPIILSLVFFYGKSTFLIIRHSKFKYKNLYLALIVLFSFIFMFADEPEFDHYSCEKNALELIANSKEEIVQLKKDCKVLNWDLIHSPSQTTDHAKLFLIWNITEEERRFYQE